MRYCPQCSAEYHDEIAVCHECGVALVEERPEGMAPIPLLSEPPRVVPRLWSQVLQGGRYAREAYGLLRRHPSLLLIPIALALFNAVESGVGRYLASTHTAYGRAVSARIRSAEEVTRGRRHYRFARTSLSTAYWSAKRVSFLHGVALLTSDAFRPIFAGAQNLATSSVMEPETTHFTPLMVGLSFLVGLLGLMVGAPIAAGYLKRLDRTVAGDAEGGLFWKDARAYAAPTMLYFLIAGLVYLPSLVVLTLAAAQGRSTFEISSLAMDWQFWLGPLCLLFLCLTPMGVVEGVPVFRAAGRSARLVWTHYLIALPLAVETTLLCLVVLIPYYYVEGMLREAWGRHSPTEGLRLIPLEAARGVALHVIAVWVVLALFMWYREARAVEEGPPVAPAEA